MISKVSILPCRRASSASGVSASTSSSGSSAGRENTAVPVAAQHHPSPLVAGEGPPAPGAARREKRTGLPGFPSQQAAAVRTPGRAVSSSRAAVPLPGGAGQPPQTGRKSLPQGIRGQGGKPRPDGEGQAPGAVRAVPPPGPRRLGGLKNRAIAGHDGQITVLPGPDQAGQSVQPVAEEGAFPPVDTAACCSRSGCRCPPPDRGYAYSSRPSRTFSGVMGEIPVPCPGGPEDGLSQSGGGGVDDDLSDGLGPRRGRSVHSWIQTPPGDVPYPAGWGAYTASGESLQGCAPPGV